MHQAEFVGSANMRVGRLHSTHLGAVLSPLSLSHCGCCGSWGCIVPVITVRCGEQVGGAEGIVVVGFISFPFDLNSLMAQGARALVLLCELVGLIYV